MNEPGVIIDLEAAASRLRRTAELQIGDGGGTYDGMDPWQQTIETRLGELRMDVRGLGEKIDNRFFWLLGVFGGGFMAVLVALATGYLRLSDAIAALPH